MPSVNTIDKAYSLYEEMNVAYKENLHVHIAMLQCLDPPLTKKQLAPLTEGVEYPAASLLSNIVTISDLVIKAVDQTKLLAFFGTKNDSQLDAAKTKSLMEKQKSAFLDALGHKGAALCRLYNITHLKRDSIDAVALTDLDTLWPDILKFTDAMDSKMDYDCNVPQLLLPLSKAHKP
uniref:Tripeptidyl peptidase II C-terminal domain-containing protein n=1 Tax=Timema monikensis TaxID=170555 RepID=A0A7R9E648_9NEOP|nr:unnamed protein product [Timema monikensis]